MAKSFTEDELRDVLVNKSEDIIRGIINRLVDDNFFKSHSFQLKGEPQADGSILVSDIEPIRRIFTDSLGTFLSEFISELIITLFEEAD